ncbi:SDR family NAD(P)-dependent oxidoreductase [Flavobacteriaceae bacterium AU392]|nr:SDR family oxidoreductase [Flavobacteriaceae bacterium]RKM85853.1 SDR family NAD(P)-dependent oxidoreductase [Flavobacteriaceae bacterium AU392]
MKNVALITGASSGIGVEFARIHAEKKGDLIIVARRREKLESLKIELEEKHQIKVKVIAKDLTQINAPKEIYDEVNNLGIEIDYLINNAGFGGHGKFYEREWENDLQMINLNIVALTALTRFFLPDLVKRNKGKILNVSSTASLMAGPLQAVYFATKAYVTSFSNAIAEELHDTNITVTALLPGATETEFARTSGMDKTDLFNKTVSPYDIAKAGYDGMLNKKLNVISGLTFAQKIMMSSIPFMPKKVMLKQVRKMQEISN